MEGSAAGNILDLDYGRGTLMVGALLFFKIIPLPTSSTFMTGGRAAGDILYLECGRGMIIFQENM